MRSNRMDVEVKPDPSAKKTVTVTDSWPVSRAAVSIRARHCRAEPTLIANRKNTPLGAVVYPDSKKIAKRALASLSVRTSCAVRTPSASSLRPLRPKEPRRPHALVLKATTATRSLVVLASPTSVRPLYLVRSHSFASLDGVRSAVKASLVASELNATRPAISVSVYRFSLVNRTCFACHPSFHLSANLLAVKIHTANTASPTAVSAILEHPETLTNLVAPSPRPATPLSAASTRNAVRDLTESIASVLLDIKEILTSPVKVLQSIESMNCL